MSERKVQDTLPSSEREDEAPEQPQTEERWKSGVAKVPLNLSEIVCKDSFHVVNPY
ncbi:uncharacterized protein SEPMUDRAFT_118445 [Sphaerulina musiva SO2202]|uniref:Uncharacterized protein n=1 Tax=Sphaerulina musiva (strain SO2202) TaxID=692275 RepID=M3CDP0_SPHMS|nr:uncharacterized protein SEPMUDRAFT_118445 [Sphaerulina musiva SO2202]EMF11141.1 hypothetical protein SEPMUDRAFT_118445 [Sphaerulina musiva SO2202]